MNHTENKNNFTRNNGPRKERPAPMHTEIQLIMRDILHTQIEEYLAKYKARDVNSRERIEADLFSFGKDHPYCAGIMGYPDHNAFILDRSVRLDRTTRELTRASCSIVLINKSSGLPEYYAYAFLTNRLTGSVAVTPITKDGPDYLNIAKIVIADEEK